MIHYICKYTPLELFAGFGQDTVVLDEMPDNFDLSDGIAHTNLCGFGKSVIQATLSGGIDELVLVNCCDTIRRVYDIIKETGICRYLYMIDLPHKGGCCEKEIFANSLLQLKTSYEEFSKKTFSIEQFRSALSYSPNEQGPYVGILGARVGTEIESMIQDYFTIPVRNSTCIGNRQLNLTSVELTSMVTEQEVFSRYAEALLSQIPCHRMNDTSERKFLYDDPNLKGIIYHTIKFCDYYGFEYAEIKNKVSVPILKLETDFTHQSKGQLQTRIEAFAETLMSTEFKETKKMKALEKYYVAGIDSGSTSTDVAILDQDKQIVAAVIIPTGGGAEASAEKCLHQALLKAGLARADIAHIVTTGYGRAYINSSDESITEITCHARGAHHLNQAVRTIIDIGGQDNKVIRIDEKGAVKNFIMNDKCAAGTGRFLEMMARTLGLNLEEMSTSGLTWKEEVVISSMCTVFAESEVVSLVAQNKDVSDIINGLNNSVAAKVSTLINRMGLEGEYMMTGGVAKNMGVVRAIENKLGIQLFICEEAQLCGAMGAALFALDQ